MFTLLQRDAKVMGILGCLSIILLAGDSIGVLGIPKSLLQRLTIPIQYGLYKTSNQVSKQFEFIVLARRAAQENKALTNQLASVLQENAQLSKKLAETQALTDQKQALNDQTFTQIPARPLGLSRYLIIDKGSDDGIKPNQTVIFKDNFIGEIKEVSNRKSTVILATDPDSKLSAFALSKDGKAKGILLGQFGSEMLLDKILHEEPINQNDLVYTSGTEVEIPRGLIVGQVQEMTIKDGEVFKQAKVKPVFDLANLDLVFVITS